MNSSKISVELYGHDVGLLSVSKSLKQSKNMTFVEESFPMWERIQQPLCPGKPSPGFIWEIHLWVSILTCSEHDIVHEYLGREGTARCRLCFHLAKKKMM